MKRPLTIFLACALATACAPTSPQSPAQRAAARAALAAQSSAQKAAAPLPDVSSPTAYRFAGKDNLNKPCSTGQHEFASRRLLCINLQDPEQNAQCALDKRLEKFHADCAPDYSWNESVSCHVALLDATAMIGVQGQYDPKHLLQSGDVCAGHGPGGLDVGGLTVTDGVLLNDIHYSLDLKFAPPNNSFFKMTITRVDTGGSRSPLIDDFEFTGGARVALGQLRGMKYQYVIRCESVWACPGSQ